MFRLFGFRLFLSFPLLAKNEYQTYLFFPEHSCLVASWCGGKSYEAANVLFPRNAGRPRGVDEVGNGELACVEVVVSMFLVLLALLFVRLAVMMFACLSLFRP